MIPEAVRYKLETLESLTEKQCDHLKQNHLNFYLTFP